MIVRNAQFVVACPVCGRPAFMHSQYVRRAMTCSHCRGHFIVYEADDGSRSAAKLTSADAIKRAEQLLHTCCNESVTSKHTSRQSFPMVLMLRDTERPVDGDIASHDGETIVRSSQPAVVSIELRARIFPRVATGVAESRRRAVHAK